MNTFYAEAWVPSANHFMSDSGLTFDQVERLREAEKRGTITDLIVSRDVDMVRAFSSVNTINL